MEENMGLEMGVETEGVANLEPEVVTEPETTEEVVTETVEATEQEPVKETEPIDVKFETAFSKRLSKATEKIKGEYEQKYNKAMKIIELGAKEYGFEDLDAYIEAVLNESEGPDTAEKQPLDPESLEILEELKEKRATEEIEREKKAYFDRQAKLLKDIGVTDLSQIPEEVLERALENDTEIAYEYLKWDKQQAIKNAKKEVIREIQETESPGSLSGGGSVSSTDITSLSWDDPKFDELLKQVKSGERTRL